MTTPSANSKDDKHNEKLPARDAGGNDPALDRFEEYWNHILKNISPISIEEFKNETIKTLYKELLRTAFDLQEEHYLPQIQQLKQQVKKLEKIAMERIDDRFSKDNSDNLLKMRIERLLEGAKELESQLLEANKRIEELEKRQEDLIDWLDENKCDVIIDGKMACVHIRRKTYSERLSCEITFSEAVEKAKEALKSKSTVPTTEANSIKP